MKTPAAIFNWKMTTIMALVIGQEVPKIIASTALPAVYRAAGLDLERFWVFSLIMVPYWLKFLIAPIVDRYSFAGIGRRKSWIIPLTLFAAVTFMILGVVPPTVELLWPLIFILVVNAALMATQDIAVDGYITDVLDDDDRDLGASLGFLAARIAYVIATAGILTLYGKLGWQLSITIAAILLLFLTLPAILRPEPRPAQPIGSSQKPSLWRFLKRRDASRIVLLQLASGFVSTFTFGLWGAFLIDKHLTLSQVGLIEGIPAIGAGLIAAWLSDWMLRRYGVNGTLRISIGMVLFAFALILWFAGIARPSFLLAMIVCVLFDVLQYPFYVTMVSLRMKWSVGDQAATDVTVLGSCANLGMTLAGAIIGFVAAGLGWSGFFIVAGIATVAVIGLFLWLHDSLEQEHRARLLNGGKDVPPFSPASVHM